MSKDNILTSEMLDQIMVEALYQQYETAYWCQQDSRRKYLSNCKKYEYVLEEIRHDEELLNSIVRVLEYNSTSIAHVAERIDNIKKKIDKEHDERYYRNMVAKKMSVQ